MHGDTISNDDIYKALLHGGNVFSASCVLLEPSEKDYNGYLKHMNQKQDTFGYANCHNCADEQSLSEYIVRTDRNTMKNKQWTYISPRYTMIPWQLECLPEEETTAIWHYFSTKPWNMERGYYDDLKPWWKVMDMILDKSPVVGKYLTTPAAM